MLPPSRKIMEFIEQNDAAGGQAVSQTGQNGLGGTVQIAIDVQEGNRLGMYLEEGGQGFAKAALQQLHIGRQICGHATLQGEISLAI